MQKQSTLEQLAVLRYPNFMLEFATLQILIRNSDTLALQVDPADLLWRKCLSYNQPLINFSQVC